MTAQEYIEERLAGIKAGNIKSDKELADFIFAIIMSKKFRKYSVSSEANDMIRKAIDLNIQDNEPIQIALPFGSYKLWKLDESPEPDWAELFSMIYFAYWLRPITDVYKPGVWFDFCGDDAILELMNNIPEEDTEKYKRVLRNLIDFMKPYLPKNFKYTFSPVGERYSSKEEFLADLNEKAGELRNQGEIALTEQDIEKIKFNTRPEEGKEIDFQENRVLHDAYLAIGKRRAHHKRPEKILISATPFGDRTSIPVGTTKTSVVKFQTGAGVLKREGNVFLEYIYSPTQLEKHKFSWEDVQIEGLTDKNFNRIRIV